ncbi:MAG: tRNA (adenosine(37)-N6)-dimethylallyltransferase MiaA [Fervidobacterium sp.]|uniref:tRNA dimethylallyltransferase n=1 Tax=Fervidobacterium gondwanense DSM 13020 TaxID=1121883 RepID=A0A1M7SB87_FERGO|nr:tRNA (adenosine(37)-N6)-dimethylallyltransferase MiaA [Fervidobacterium gondwanense]UXF00424.1 tRNA delta(2)-isopentenylpyrophosphate transferase [Fervidobacterium riparium]SHN55743.1 tRNA dimethylallyltransferase [Fervidobacterium gondwanense DSM 13020]
MKRIIISGPTASGKTDIVVELSKRIPIEVISMDSRQIYKYMDIGTAKPDPYQLTLVKHHMIDIIEPNEYFNAFLYQKEAKEIEKEILERGKIPIYVGGTGLYIDALVKGFFEGVSRDENIRKELSKLNEQEPGILRKMLEEFDPQAASHIHPQDIKRTIRALEVYLKTGKRISELQKQQPTEDFILLVLNPKREELYERINHRAEKMIEHGLIDEVKNLVEKYGDNLESFKTIGYREIIDYLNGVYSLETAIHLIKRNTRHYARRQIIYLRRFNNAIWIEPDKDTVENIENIIRKEYTL